MADRLVGTGELARALGISPTSIRSWLAEGVISPSLRTKGGHYRWDVDDVRAQLKAYIDAARERDKRE